MARMPANAVQAWLDRHFSVALPFTRFARNIALLSLAGLAPALGLFVALSPGLWAHLLTTDAALVRFLRQILTNGLPVVLVINALGLILYAQLRASRLSAARALAIDIPARIVAFFALHATIYPGSALLFGAFGGDPVQALRVMLPTLAQSAAFANLSGVYLYATLTSALPVHMALLAEAATERGLRAPLIPISIPVSIPVLILLALTIFGVQAVLLSAIALLLQGRA